MGAMHAENDTGLMTRSAVDDSLAFEGRVLRSADTLGGFSQTSSTRA